MSGLTGCLLYSALEAFYALQSYKKDWLIRHYILSK